MTKEKSKKQGYSTFRIGRVNSNSISSLTPIAPPDPENIMFFERNYETDEELVRKPKIRTYLPIKILINDSEISRIAKRNRKYGTNIARRCQNMWIIYRRDKSAMPEFLGLKSSIVSKIISKMWNNEPNEVKEFYAALYRLAVKNYIRKYGNKKTKRSSANSEKNISNFIEKHTFPNLTTPNRLDESSQSLSTNTKHQQLQYHNTSLSNLLMNANLYSQNQFFPTPVISNNTSHITSSLEFSPPITNAILHESTNDLEQIFQSQSTIISTPVISESSSNLSEMNANLHECESTNNLELIMNEEQQFSPPPSDITQTFATFNHNLSPLEIEEPPLNLTMGEYQFFPPLSAISPIPVTSDNHSPPLEIGEPLPILSELMSDCDLATTPATSNHHLSSLEIEELSPNLIMSESSNNLEQQFFKLLSAITPIPATSNYHLSSLEIENLLSPNLWELMMNVEQQALSHPFTLTPSSQESTTRTDLQTLMTSFELEESSPIQESISYDALELQQTNNTRHNGLLLYPVSNNF